jgi:hypothetical protein
LDTLILIFWCNGGIKIVPLMLKMLHHHANHDFQIILIIIIKIHTQILAIIPQNQQPYQHIPFTVLNFINLLPLI